MKYTVGKPNEGDNGYEVFILEDREQIAADLTEENAELICKLLNDYYSKEEQTQESIKEESNFRDHLAGVALNAILQAYPKEHVDWLARNAYLTADAMLNMRKQC